MSGSPQAIALGERLFFSPSLSGTGSLLCASCHQPWRHGADGRARALGLGPVERNTPSLDNVGLQRWFGWDGANDTLWGQSLRPLLDAREMHSSAAHIAARMRSDPVLSAQYGEAFGSPLPADDEEVLVDVGKVLAAYQETLLTGRTPFDEFRDAAFNGDRRTAARYPQAAQRGLALFAGKAGCAGCHSGPLFSDGHFHRLWEATGGEDRGREVGLARLAASRYTRGGPFSDLPADAKAGGAPPAVSGDEAGAFRTPGLRNVALTAPYLHDGSAADLCLLLGRHFGAGLQRGERNDLVAFLESLGDAPPQTQAACR